MNLVERALTEHFDTLGLETVGLGRRLQTTVLTPRFPTSRHVVALVFDDGDPRPRAVAKVPRQLFDDGGVLLEAQVLASLHGSASGTFRGAPALLGTVDVHGRTMLVESAVQGTPLEPRLVAADPGRAVRAAAAFLAELPVTRAAEDGHDWYQRTLTAPLADLAARFPLGGETARLCDRTHALLEPLRGVALPAVFEHGDLSHPNLFTSADGGSLLAIDWERADPAGLPGHDFVFFLQYVGRCVHGGSSRADQFQAFDDAFAGATGWARPALDAHLSLRGVPPELSGLLVLASWARTAATLASRLGADGAGTGSAAAAEQAVSADRDMDLWRHAVARAEAGALS